MTLCSIPISFGELVAIHRTRLKMSQSALANAVGISRNYISLIERGNENVSYSVVLKICNVVGLEISIGMAAGGLTPRALDAGQGCPSCSLGLCPDGNGGFIPCTICGNTVQPKTAPRQ